MRCSKPRATHQRARLARLLLVLTVAAGTAEVWAQSTTPRAPGDQSAERTGLGGPLQAPAPTAPPTREEISDSLRGKLGLFTQTLWPEAQKRGISRALFERALSGFDPDPDIFELLANQPEHVTAPWDYLNRLVSDRRIATGRDQLAAQQAVLNAVEARFGVDKHVLLAIWGVESSFGASMGTRHVIRSLMTLALGEPRRPQFWRTELLNALIIVERGDITLEEMTGSWAGAMGHTQFMPSSYLANAVDYDGDGRRDIWTSIPDALASTANYLKLSGWKAESHWGAEVNLPARFDLAHTRPGVAMPLEAWLGLGVTLPALQSAHRLRGPLSLILPAGVAGPAFLVGENFRAILKYNNATAYALAVGHLADRIGGGVAITGAWPLDDPPINRAGREELQRRLSALGFETGPADGLIGAASRAAIRAYQAKHGLPEDGWSGERLLERLRAEMRPQ